jgi:dephospho-CoA kinase
MIILGITGTLGAGKGTVVEYLVQQKGFAHVAVSDTFLTGEAIKRGREPDRQARHEIANEFRAKGPTKLMEAVYTLAEPLIAEGKDVVIEPQHSIDEVKFVQSKGGVVLAVNADLEMRYQRIQERGGPKDNVSFEAFKAHEEKEMRPTQNTTNDLAGALAQADHTIMNDGSVEDLHAQIDAVLQKLDL